jgi:predicted nucleotidyltransferase
LQRCPRFSIARQLCAGRRTCDAETLRAVETFVRLIRPSYSFRNIIVFGSRARGEHRQDSDLDLAIILEGETGDRAKIVREMAGLAFDAMLESGVLVSPLPIWSIEFDNPETFSRPDLIKAIRRDGVAL